MKKISMSVIFGVIFGIVFFISLYSNFADALWKSGPSKLNVGLSIGYVFALFALSYTIKSKKFIYVFCGLMAITIILLYVLSPIMHDNTQILMAYCIYVVPLDGLKAVIPGENDVVNDIINFMISIIAISICWLKNRKQHKELQK